MKQRRLKGDRKPENEIVEFVKEHCPDFEYVGGYTGCDGRADVRCVRCGTVINRSMISIRKNHIGCPKCGRRVTLGQEAKAKKKKRAEERRDREKEIIENRINRSRQIEIGVCEVCGNWFYKKVSNQIYCSGKCRSRVLNSRSEVCRRERIKAVMVDKDITVEGLFRRDKGICYLCGRECSFDDYVIRDGVFIAGDWYPSIDHVIPLSKGGVHSWDNVKLAHRRCNLIKRDK